MPFSRSLPPLRAPADTDAGPATGAPLVVLGMGSVVEGGGNSIQLLQTNVTVSSPQACNSSYGGIIRDTQICCGEEGPRGELAHC